MERTWKMYFFLNPKKTFCHFYPINYLEILKQQKDFCQLFSFITQDVTAH